MAGLKSSTTNRKQFIRNFNGCLAGSGTIINHKRPARWKKNHRATGRRRFKTHISKTLSWGLNAVMFTRAEMRREGLRQAGSKLINVYKRMKE